MASKDLEVKRLRRQYEPEDKAWDDEALEITWEEIDENKGVSEPTLYAMRNILFFPLATAVQAQTIPKFRNFGNSVVVEAATGSGKTVSFLVPIVERILKCCLDVVRSAAARPLLTRSISAIVLSPSGVLAQQTYAVGRALVTRFPFGISCELCDSSNEPVERTLQHLQTASRGGGVILVTTPRDLVTLMDLMQAHSAKVARSVGKKLKGKPSEDDVAVASSRAKRPRDHLEGAGAQVQTQVQPSRTLAQRVSSNDLLFEGLPYATSTTLKTKGHVMLDEEFDEIPTSKPSGADLGAPSKVVLDAISPLAIVIDEADVVLRSRVSRDNVNQCIQRILATGSGASKPKIDIGLFGATVSSAHITTTEFLTNLGIHTEEDLKKIEKQKKKLSKKSDEVETEAATHSESKLHHIVAGSEAEFISKLRNCVHITGAGEVLEALLHLINLHPTKKHFVFFNNPEALLLVHKVLLALLKPTKALLHVPTVFILHEGLTDNQKLSNYNGFLKHQVVLDKKAKYGSRDDPNKVEGGIDGPAKGAIGAATHKQGPGKVAAQFRQSTKLKKATHKNNTQLGHAMRHVDFSASTKAKLAASRGAILLCTDFAAFGLDVRDVDYVYHFDLPLTTENYVHRIGRVARMGMRGTSVLLMPESRQEGEHFKNLSTAKLGRASKKKSQAEIEDDLLADSSDDDADVDETGHQGEEGADGSDDEDDLPVEKKGNLEVYRLPPNKAPLASMIHGIVTSDPELTGLAINAAKRMVLEFNIPQPTSVEPPAGKPAVDKKTEEDEDEDGERAPITAGAGLYPRSDPTPLQLVLLEN